MQRSSSLLQVVYHLQSESQIGQIEVLQQILNSNRALSLHNSLLSRIRHMQTFLRFLPAVAVPLAAGALVAQLLQRSHAELPKACGFVPW